MNVKNTFVIKWLGIDYATIGHLQALNLRRVSTRTRRPIRITAMKGNFPTNVSLKKEEYTPAKSRTAQNIKSTD